MNNKKKEDNTNISFSQENVLRYRKTRNIIAVERTDWDRLVRMINKYTKISLIWWAVFSFFLSLSIQLLISYYSLPLTSSVGSIFFACFAVAMTATILTLIFAIIQKNTESVKKKDILGEMERVKNALNEEQDLDSIDDIDKEESSHDDIETFTIIKATYGTEEKNVNVTRILTDIIVEGKLITKASNSLVKEDPTPGVKKVLVIEYEHNGVIKEENFNEGNEVVLP